MILLVHLLLGALIGQKISNPVAAVLLAFLSHYFLDFFPHIEYSIENITEKRWKKSAPDLIRVFFDFTLGIILIFAFSKNQAIIYICALFAILPDGLSVLGSFLKNKLLVKHNLFHQEKIHYFKHKKISNLWRIFSQVIVVALCLLLFKI